MPEAFTVATEMAQVHNIFIRSLNAIILQAPNIERPQDIADFVFFCAAVCSGVDEHHETEETFLFPLIEQHTEKGIMEQNIEQHELFHHGLRLFKTYVLQVKNGTARGQAGPRLQCCIDPSSHRRDRYPLRTRQIRCPVVQSHRARHRACQPLSLLLTGHSIRRFLSS